MNDAELKPLVASLTYSRLAKALALRQAVTLYKNGQLMPEAERGLWEDAMIQLCKNWPGGKALNDEELCNVLNNPNGELTQVQTDLFYFLLGERMSPLVTNANFSELVKWWDDNFNYGFMLGLRLSDAAMEQIVSRFVAYPDRLKKAVERMSIERSYFIDLSRMDIGEDNWEDLKSIFQNAAYVYLPQDVNLLSFNLLRKKNYALWLKLWIGLGNLTVESLMLYWIDSVADCLEITNALLRAPYKKKEPLHYLLRERMVMLLTKEQENLLANLNCDDIRDKQMKEAVASCSADLLDKYDKWLDPIANAWKRGSEQKELLEWADNVRVQLGNRRGPYADQTKELIGKLLKKLVVRINQGNVDFDGKNAVLLLEDIKRHCHKAWYKADFFKRLITAFLDRLYDKPYGIRICLDKDSLEYLRAMYECLNRSKLDGFELLLQRRPYDEGFINVWNNSFPKKHAEAIWLSALILRAEQRLFRKDLPRLQEYLLNNVDVLDRIRNEDYAMPFIIMENLVTEIMPKLKNKWELGLITKMDSLKFVLKVLSAINSVPSQRNTKPLMDRISREWEIEKTLALKEEAPIIEKIDKYINKLYSTQ